MSNFEIAIPLIFELERRTKSQNVGKHSVTQL